MRRFRPTERRALVWTTDDRFLSPSTRRLAQLTIGFLIGVIVFGCLVAAGASLLRTMLGL